MSHSLFGWNEFNKNKFSKLLSIALFGILGNVNQATAAEFNVSNEAELNAAIAVAVANQDDDIIDFGNNAIELTNKLWISNMDEFEIRIQNGTLRRAANTPEFGLVAITTGTNGSKVAFEEMILEGGSESNGGGAIYADTVDIEIRGSIVRNNQAVGGAGGAVYIRSKSIEIANSTFSNNFATLQGGALAISGAQSGFITDTVFDANTSRRGAAIFINRMLNALTITKTSFTQNESTSQGGAIWSRDEMDISLSTFYQNKGAFGGAIYLQPLGANDRTTITRTTFFDNLGTNVADTLYFQSRLVAPVLRSNIIIGSNQTISVNCTDTSSSANPLVVSNNVSEDSSCGSTNFVTGGASLFTTGVAADNGGNTPTIALNPTSPAIDVGAPLNAGSCTVPSDQRGEPVLGNCDAGSFEFQPIASDSDNDGTPDASDNCPTTPNEDQDDFDLDGLGDACDDSDGDSLFDDIDNCPTVSNANQTNTDNANDGGDVCDNDDDNDGVNDGQDAFPLDVTESSDNDNDGTGDNADLDDDNDLQSDINELACGSDPLNAASLSADADGDNIPDCADNDDPDTDGDTIPDAVDNCPAVANQNQTNTDNANDGGDACDSDDDNDGVADGQDAFPLDASESLDTDGDGTGNNADLDDDGDNQSDANELSCGSDPLDATSLSADIDGDNIPDCEDNNNDLDNDNDGVLNDVDNCPAIANADQLNTDNANDGGDACDNDDDNDGINDISDAFPLDATESLDTDGDGIGNNADLDDDNDGQSDINEGLCGSNPFDSTSTSPDADNDGIPDCEDDTNNLDTDGDGILNDADNCPTIANANQLNTDGANDGGNACDNDDDNDNVSDANDAFPLDASESVDTDGDGTGNNADLDDDNDNQSDLNELSCGSDPLDANSLSADVDGDNIPDCEDDNNALDIDSDGILNDFDNCPAVSNPNQLNTDGANDGGNACDTDDDNDNVPDFLDAFPLDASEAVDSDGDGVGNNADLDDDNDGQLDANEIQCGSDSLDANSLSSDVDGDGIPDCADDSNGLDADGDGVNDNVDNCPAIVNPGQLNTDGANDGGNACDTDDDNDGVLDINDAFPLNSNESSDNDGDNVGDNADLDDDNDGQLDQDELNCNSDPLDANVTAPDADGDNIPNCVDPDFFVDTDGDGVADNLDNCPAVANANQADSDGNGIGDACDVTTGPGNIKPSIAEAAASLNWIIASAENRLVKYYLEYAKRQLDTAITDSYWSDNDTVTDRRGRTVFYRVGLAVYKLELVADSRLTDPALKTSLDAITATLLDNMRLLAANELNAAVAANGNEWRILIAQKYLEAGDKYRNQDYLSGAVSKFGYAWYYANIAM